MSKDLSNWKGCLRPQRKIMEGQYVRLEPLDFEKHGDGIYEATSGGEGADLRMKYLWEYPESKEKLRQWFEKFYGDDETIFYALVDKKTGIAGGRQSFLRIDAEHGVAEIGHILWGPRVSKTRMATEALYLFGCHLFDELGYRRYEWKCHNMNAPSKKAALRFGFSFDGTFRQDYVMKGENRDTAWFSIIDKDWPARKETFERWLDPSNFDENGVQKKRLEEFRSPLPPSPFQQITTELVKLPNWKGCPTPQRKIMEGRFVRLEPLDPSKHGDELYALSSGPNAEADMKFLWQSPQTRPDFDKWLAERADPANPLVYHVLIDKENGKLGGRQNFLNICSDRGVVEIGGIHRGPTMARKPHGTEAIFLYLSHVFDELGYRRVEWKTHNENEPSKVAARRLGFQVEAIFPQHYVMKGANRDTIYFSIIDKEWPKLKLAYEKWLSSENIDESGLQKKRLQDFM